VFAIDFIQKPKIEYGELGCRGRITLGNFSEEFISPLIFWSEDEYRKQWHQAAERIMNGYMQSCFVTAMRKSLFDGAIFMWPAYNVGETVHIQHRLVMPDTVEGTFDPFDPYAQITERQTLSEDDLTISEWKVSIEDIARFLAAG
jgi:hypothetical protein